MSTQTTPPDRASAQPELLSPEARRRLLAVGRWSFAVVLAALVGAAVFLVMVQGSAHKGFTDLDFNHTLGVLVGGDAFKETSHAALGVSGDSAAPTGLLWTALCALAVVVVYGLLAIRWRRVRWYVSALPLGLAVFLLVSLVYMPLVDARVDDVTTGPFGIDGGGITPVVFLISSLGFALVVARVFALGVDPAWWVVRRPDAEAALSEFEGVEDLELGEAITEDEMRPSLKLPEERSEDGDVGARR